MLMLMLIWRLRLRIADCMLCKQEAENLTTLKNNSTSTYVLACTFSYFYTPASHHPQSISYPLTTLHVPPVSVLRPLNLRDAALQKATLAQSSAMVWYCYQVMFLPPQS